MTRHYRPGRRPGFTLIELLVVIVILGILIGLLVPAIASAVRTARGAAVQSEINQLGQALADFRSKYGDYPPSRFMVNENGFYDTTNSTVVSSGAGNDVTYGQIAQRSISALRKFFPQAVVSTSGAVFAPSSKVWYDFNGNVAQDFDPNGAGVGYVLDGSQCLVFFLGGIPQIGPNGSVGMTGFSKSPKNPFFPPSTSGPGANRTTPLFEFSADRLVLNPNPATATTTPYPYMPSYLDSLKSSSTVPAQNVYAYFSSNLGAGYDPNDVNFIGNPFATKPILGPVAEADSLNPPNNLGLTFTVTQPTFTSAGKAAATTTSPTPNPYTSTPSTGTGPVTYINNQSFQIISAGVDGVFGLGGVYTPNAAGAVLPVEASTSPDTAIRTFEADNLTNFHPGKLQ